MAAELASDLPVWAQTAGIIGTVLGTSLLAMWRNKKKGDAEEVLPGATEHRVVAASFVDGELLKSLIATLGEVRAQSAKHCEAVTCLTQETRKLYDLMHEEALVRTLAARMAEQKGKLG